MASDPETAARLTTISVTGHSQGPKSTLIETPKAEFVVGKEASPLEYLLGSLAACINVIGHLVAKDRDLVIRDIDVTVEGDIDPTKYKGESTDPRAGFQSMRVTVSVDADADQSTLESWMDEVADRCPVADNLRNGVGIDVAVEAA